MTTRTRLNKARTQLSPKQIVLLTLKEAHAAGSAWAYAKKAIRMGREKDICALVEAAVTGTQVKKWSSSPGEYSENMTNTIREAQREGMFLWGLAMRCNESLLEAKEAIDLRWMLWNMSMLLLGEWGERASGEDSPPLTLDRVMSEVRLLRTDLVAHAKAIATIEKTYFGGQGVIFPDMRQWLDKRLSGVVELLEAVDRSIRSKSTGQWATLLERDEGVVEAVLGPMREPAGKVWQKAERRAATALVHCWVRLVQSRVHDRMGERGAAEACLLHLVREKASAM